MTDVPPTIVTLEVGDVAPVFSLPDGEGAVVELASLRGQWVVVYFYPRDNTPGCTKEACGFRQHYAALQVKNVQVLGISTDTAASHQKFSRKYSLPFPLLVDDDGAVAQAYGSYGPKQFMGKEFIGVFRKTFIIDPTGKIAKIYHKVKPDGHGDEVVKDLRSLQAA